MKSKKSISNTFMAILIIMSFLPVLIMGGLMIHKQYTDFHKTSDQLRKDYIKAQEKIVKFEIENVVSYIEWRKANAKIPDADLKKGILAYLSKRRYTSRGKEEGIFFARTYQGIHLMSVSRPELVGKDTSKDTDPDGINMHQLFRKTVRNPAGGYVEYSWFNPATGKVEPKRSFVKGIPDWQWYIGTGFWYTDINTVIEQKKAQLRQVVGGYLTAIGLCLLSLFALSFMASRYLTRKTRESFGTFSTFFKEAATHSGKINLSKLNYSEFAEMAILANQMVVDREEIAKDLRESEEKYRSMMESMKDAAYICSQDFRLEYMNPAMIESIGHDATGGRCHQAIYNQDEPCPWCVLDRIQEGKHFEYESTNPQKNEHFIISNSPIFHTDGSISQLTILRDITERKAVEKKLRRYHFHLEKLVSERTAKADQRAEQLQQLALELTNAEDRERKRISTILHDDFQQLLALIKIKINMLFPREQMDGQLGEKVGFINQLVSECIEKSRNLSYELNPPSLRLNGLRSALFWLAEDLRKNHSLRVRIQTNPGAEPASLTLASILFRSVRELLINVVKHADVQVASIHAHGEADHIRIRVVDTGKGFDYGAVTTQQKTGAGAGFGLFSIEDRIKFLGGHMTVNSVLNKGTCITLVVPKVVAPDTRQLTMTEGPPETHTRPQVDRIIRNRPPAQGHRIRILLADDHKLLREGLANLLQSETDLEIIAQAVNGSEAVRLSSELKPDVVLMDVTMPEMGGIEATSTIRNSDPGIQVIGLSMHNDSVTRQKMLKAGAMAYLSKSGSTDELIEAVRRVFREGN